MSRTSQEIRLAARPQGRPDASTWELATTEVAEPGPGEFLVQLQQISLDPAMRGWLNDVRSYLPPVKIGAVMRAFGAGTVIASQHDDFAVGDVVSGTFGVREYAISDGTGVAHLDLDVAPMSTWLGALGMPGMTAWFGLEDVGRAQPGDTVLVSAAAGAGLLGLLTALWPIAYIIVMAVWLAILIFAPRAIAAVNLLSLAMLVAMLGWIIDSWRLWAGVKKQLNTKYPGVSRKGLLSYLNNRAMTPRRWRNPVPRVERGSHRRA